ncbi:MAG: hypothetical protein JRF40_15410 [Deltaproteobacteria bacterium]|nr:hypothetical protein [Deltaproteobacteria bacterium]
MPRDVYGKHYELLMKDYELFKNKDTEITIKDVPTGIVDFELLNFLGFREINNIEVVKAMIKAEAEGYDGVAGACYFDSGIKAASNLLSIPVVGPAEASMHLACMMGKDFTVITSDPKWIKEIEHNLVKQGFGPFAISNNPVRSMTIPMNEMFEGLMRGSYDAIIDNFTEVGRQSLDDGAQVIIAGCGLVSPIFSLSRINEIEGAPIIDPMIASLKMTEMMVTLARAGMPVKSKRGLHRTPVDELRLKGIKELRLG